MKHGRRIYYTDAQKALMWDRLQKGESLHAAARLFDRGHSSVSRILALSVSRCVRTEQSSNQIPGASLAPACKLISRYFALAGPRNLAPRA